MPLLAISPGRTSELREYEKEARSSTAFVREWPFDHIHPKWEWQTLRVVVAGEIFGEGDRSTWEAGVRQFLLG